MREGGREEGREKRKEIGGQRGREGEMEEGEGREGGKKGM